MKNYVTILGIALASAVPTAAYAQSVTPPPVPTGIEVGPPNVAFLLGRAVGTQNYECQPVNSVGRLAPGSFSG
jgi:hypothetical protein